MPEILQRNHSKLARVCQLQEDTQTDDLQQLSGPYKQVMSTVCLVQGLLPRRKIPQQIPTSSLWNLTHTPLFLGTVKEEIKVGSI